MNFKEEPRKKSKKKINIVAAIVGFVICLVVGFFVGKLNGTTLINVPQSSSNKILEVYDILKNDWFNTGEELNIDETLANAMVSSLGDPYNSYFTQDGLTSFNDNINKNYEGIGVAFNVSTGVPIITEVYAGSPAAAAGLQDGDILTSVDGVTLEGMSSEDIASRVKGESGTSVVIGVLRGQENLEFCVTRQAVDYSALYELKESNGKSFGLITLSSFGTSTASHVKEALDYFVSQSIDTIVLDLRDNPGGYLQAAKGILDLFLKEGQTEFIIEEKDGKQTSYVSENNEPYIFKHGYILMNGSSASASEVVAGALQEVLGYQVVGSQSYGKGVAQTQKTLSDLSVVKYTYAKWLLPSGESIDKVGITPDVEVDNIDTSELYTFTIDEPLTSDIVDERVIQLQKMLAILGYEVDRQDGYFSENTKEALMNFERDHGLTEDGEFSNDDKEQLINEVVAYVYSEENDAQLKKVEELIQ